MTAIYVSINVSTTTAKIYGQKNNLLPKKIKNNQSSPPFPTVNVLWLGINSPTFSYRGRGNKDEFLLWPQYYRRDCLDFKNYKKLIIFYRTE